MTVRHIVPLLPERPPASVRPEAGQHPGHHLRLAAVQPFAFGRAAIGEQRFGGDGRTVGGFVGGLFRGGGGKGGHPARRINGGVAYDT
jgi:hypothetical protein